MLDSGKQKLIATIYSATLSPQGFEELVDDLSSEVVDLVSDIVGFTDLNNDLPDESAVYFFDQTVLKEIAGHVRNVSLIQARIGHYDRDEERIEFLLGSVPNPAIVFDARERIVRANELARRQRHVAADTLPDLFDDEQMVEIRKAVSGLVGDSAFASVPLFSDLDKNENICVLIKRLQRPDQDDPRPELFLLSVADFGFDETVRSLFKATYDLTEAEAAVATLLASGARPEEIAERRAVSLGTVRTQIKAVKQKTKVRDLPHLVRLLCGYSAGLLIPGRFAPDDTDGPADNLTAQARDMTLGDGRRLQYFVQGDPSGRPVLLLHNIPYGAILPRAAIARAAARGLRIIAPLRPGIGDSDPLPDLRREALLDRVVGDTAEFLDRLGIDKVQVLGNTGGCTYAVRFARTFPERVSDIVMVSRAPIWKSEWQAGLPKLQRLLAILVKFMPSMANLVIWSALSYLNRTDPAKFLRESVKGSKSDLRALEVPEIVSMIADGFRFGLRQGPDGFSKDWELMGLDLTAEARTLPHPIHIVHGDDDPVIPVEQSMTFVENVPHARLDVVRNAGNFLFYSHWPIVLDALLDARLYRPSA